MWWRRVYDAHVGEKGVVCKIKHNGIRNLAVVVIRFGPVGGDVFSVYKSTSSPSSCTTEAW